MKTTIRILSILFVCALFMGEGHAVQASESTLAGVWQGALDVGPMKLRIVFDIKADEGGKLVGTLDSPDQQAFGMPIDSIGVEGDAVTIELNRIQGTFSGTLSADAEQIDGTWSQMGRTFPLVMQRGEKIQPARRPQEPQPPLPYAVEEVSYQNEEDDVRIAGTLTRPHGNGAFPAVLLITGSGPQDRDETLMGHKPFLVLADYLTRRGFAVLRADDRGVGESTGSVMQSTVDDFAQDTLAGVAYLRSRTDIGLVGLIGHSEGGIVASMAATAAPDIAYVVLIASPGVRIDALLIQQVRAMGSASGMSKRMVDFSASLQHEIFEIIRSTSEEGAATARIEALWAERKSQVPKDERTPADEANWAAFDAGLKTQTKMLMTPWFRDLLDRDPAASLRQLRNSVLAIFAELDVQVPPEHNVPALEKALQVAQNPDVTVVQMPGLNHLMQTARTGLPAEYAKIEETFDPAALEAIGAWLQTRAQNRKDDGES